MRTVPPRPSPRIAPTSRCGRSVTQHRHSDEVGQPRGEEVRAAGSGRALTISIGRWSVMPARRTCQPREPGESARSSAALFDRLVDQPGCCRCVNRGFVEQDTAHRCERRGVHGRRQARWRVASTSRSAGILMRRSYGGGRGFNGSPGRPGHERRPITPGRRAGEIECGDRPRPLSAHRTAPSECGRPGRPAFGSRRRRPASSLAARTCRPTG
jgi:hypothetical protein